MDISRLEGRVTLAKDDNLCLAFRDPIGCHRVVMATFLIQLGVLAFRQEDKAREELDLHQSLLFRNAVLVAVDTRASVGHS